MLQDVFTTLGFREEELKTYLLMLDKGACTAGDLAKLMSAPRPSVYGYLERLIEGGLVLENIQRGVKIFVPEPGEKIRLLYKLRIEDLKAKEKSLDVILPALQKHSGLHYLRPRMQFFEGRQNVELALEDLLNFPDSTMTYSFWPILAAMAVTSSEFFRYHNLERIRRNIFVQAIWPRTQGVEIKQHPYMGWGPEFKREARYAPAGLDASMGYWIYGHKVLFISSRAESYGFVMESAELAQMMLAQHQIIWAISEPVQFDRNSVKPFIEEIGDV